ncbi:MAG: hypothetical protein AAF149_24805, partial [Bacteroidota bacterium]
RGAATLGRGPRRVIEHGGEEGDHHAGAVLAGLAENAEASLEGASCALCLDERHPVLLERLGFGGGEALLVDRGLEWSERDVGAAGSDGIGFDRIERLSIEKAFRISKHDLKIRPIYHRARRRIEAHICLSIEAYKIYKELERQLKVKKMNISPEKAIDIARTIYKIQIRIDKIGSFDKVLLLNEKHRWLNENFGLKT